jgi:hypothetical protein
VFSRLKGSLYVQKRERAVANFTILTVFFSFDANISPSTFPSVLQEDVTLGFLFLSAYRLNTY